MQIGALLPPQRAKSARWGPRLGAVLALSVVAAVGAGAQSRSLDDFFRTFAAEWVRGNPNQAVSTRYLSGPEQEPLERELTPVTGEWQRGRVRLAARGLAELRRFDRAGLAPAQRTAAEVLDWQLDTSVRGEPCLDYVFPFEQLGGVNVSLVTTLTVSHPVRSARDAWWSTPACTRSDGRANRR